jgi:phosphopantetheinyl transferase (holo-ACP synthase)
VRPRAADGSWAAKEAAYKALPHWPAGWGWKNVDLSYTPRGRPVLALLPPQGRDAEAVARRRERKGEEGGDIDPERVGLMLSLSHDGDMIVAAVVAQLKGD